MTVRLVAAGAAHAAVLSTLHGECFEAGWDTATMAAFLATPGALASMALVDEAPVGFVLARIAADEAEIIAIGILESRRHQGIGRRLMGEAVARTARAGAVRMFLEVGESNVAARACYGSIGFVEAGRRLGYYRRKEGREDALILGLAHP